MKWVGTFIVASYGLIGIWTITLMNTEFLPFGDLSYGEYSIFSSRAFFNAYHIWGFVLSAVVLYGMWKEVRLIFMVGLMLLTLQMFYPWFTSSPGDREAGKQRMEQIQKEKEQTKQDSIQKSRAGSSGTVRPPDMHQLSADTTVRDSE